MKDTNKQIVRVFRADQHLSSSEVYSKISEHFSLVTVKRGLSELTKRGFLERSGAGRSVSYQLTQKGALLSPIDVQQYLDVAQENRQARTSFNDTLYRGKFVPLLEDALSDLDLATAAFRLSSTTNAPVRNKELQRFVVEMSWKSAQIEGNTYTLLDTEKLLRYGIRSTRNTEFETQMLLNQKAAFDFVYQTRKDWRSPSWSQIDHLHKLIISNLGIPAGVRKIAVGVTGTEYRPLENYFQISEAVDLLLSYTQQAPNSYEQALWLIIGLSYIQPFNDGNKRTARMLANAVLLANDLAPVSYRSVDEVAYKEALLVFYEQNSAVAFRDLFVQQYAYSAKNYNLSTRVS